MHYEKEIKFRCSSWKHDGIIVYFGFRGEESPRGGVLPGEPSMVCYAVREGEREDGMGGGRRRQREAGVSG